MLVQPGSVADTIDDPRWTPLRVVATMAEPIVIDTNRLHLDGPLSWCAYLAPQRGRQSHREPWRPPAARSRSGRSADTPPRGRSTPGPGRTRPGTYRTPPCSRRPGPGGAWATL